MSTAANPTPGTPDWNLPLGELAAQFGLATTRPGEPLRGVATDSRAVRPGDLFVALTGERVDGHDFVGQALAAGAATALVERVPAGIDAAAVLPVPSTVTALGQLGAWWRGRIDPAVIAITGSNGITTVK